MSIYLRDLRKKTQIRRTTTITTTRTRRPPTPAVVATISTKLFPSPAPANTHQSSANCAANQANRSLRSLSPLLYLPFPYMYCALFFAYLLKANGFCQPFIVRRHIK